MAGHSSSRPDSVMPPGPVSKSQGRRAIATGLFMLGSVGLLLAVLPWSSIIQTCPYLVRNAWSSVLSPLQFLSATRHVETLLQSSSSGSKALPEARGHDLDTGLPLFTSDDLRLYTGADGYRILLGMNGNVYDVTDKGSQFYGPGTAYALFAGRDSTRCLALGSLDEADLKLGGYTGDFTAEQLKALEEQHQFYLGKYPVVGKLLRAQSEVEPDSLPAGSHAGTG